MNIFDSDFSISREENVLICNISDKKKRNYAFYVSRNNKIIHKGNYSTESTFKFILNKYGYYSVVAFIKDADGERTASKPKFLFYFKEGDVSKIDISDSAISYKTGIWNQNCLFFHDTKDKKNKKMFVLLSGAINRNISDPPVFHRHTWAANGLFTGHVLCIADASVHDDNDLELGWYIGNEKGELLDQVLKIVESYQSALDIADKNVIFWGSSGGGFASLSLASKKEGSVAVAINAQTNIFKYEIKRAVRELMTTIGCEGKERYLEKSPVFNLYLQKFDGNRLFLVQNIIDEHHLNAHFWSFSNNLLSQNFNVKNYFICDNRGHVGETADVASEIVKMLDFFE